MSTLFHSAHSTDDAVRAMADKLNSRNARKANCPKHRELVRMIESGRHLLVGAKALAYYAKPRFTEDTDYIVSGLTFERIRKWLRKNEVSAEDLGLVIRFQALGLAVIDARGNAVLKELMKRENGIPSPEALAAAKYIAIVSQDRGRRRLMDAADFAELVALDHFDLTRLQTYLVAPYADQWSHVEKLIDDIKNGRPITI